MSFDKVEVRVFSGPDQVQVGSNTEPDLIVMNIGPKGDTGATGNTGPAGPNSVTSATTSDGTGNLSLSNVSTATATVSSLLTAGHIHGNLAGTLYTHVRTGEAMSKGDPFYISGFHVGSSQPIAMRADAANASKMPAVGVMDADYAINTSSANGIISGTLSSVDTDGYSVNSPIYVANGGGYSNTAGTIPQQVGITERANVSTGAFIVTNSKVISFADVSDAQAGTADLILENLTATNLGSVTASIGSSLVVGDGDSVKGRYDIFSNTSHFQWYSDSVLYGERSFTITTENLTSSGSYSYKYPVGTGTFALTANTNGEPDKLTSGTISGATTFNATSYTYGTGAAAAHRTALGLTTLATTTPGTNVATFLATPTSDNLASALTDENGTGGGFVRAEGATLTTPTFTGSAARANGQNIMPATGDEVINFDSLIVASQYMFAWRQGEILNTVTGSASANSAGFHATGTTPNSSAYSRYFLSGGYPTYISTGAYPYSGLNWTRRIVLTGAIAVPSSVNSSAAVIRVVLGEAIANTTLRDLVNRGVGLKIESGNIKLMVHNGTTLTIGSAVGTLTNNAQYFRIDSYNGTVKLYINNVLVDTTTSGPTSVGPEALVTQTQNGNVSEAQNFWLTQAKIWTL